MDDDEVAAILNFYSEREQSGNGLNYFFTPYSQQRGSGIGSFLSGVSRPLIPLARRGVAYLAPHLLKILRELTMDVVADPTPSTFNSSLKNRAINTLENISQDVISKMKGGRLRVRRRAAPTIKKVKRKTIKRRVAKPKRSVKRKTSTKRRRRVKKTIEYPLFK